MTLTLGSPVDQELGSLSPAAPQNNCCGRTELLLQSHSRHLLSAITTFMSQNPHDRSIRIIENYFGIGADDAGSMLEQMRAVDLRGGDWLFHQGDAADAIYFLVRGRLQVWISDDTDDRQHLLGEISAGESVGEIGLLTGGIRSAGIRSIRDCHLLRLDKTVFEHFAADHPQLVLQLATSIAARLSERTRRGARASREWTTVALLPLDRYPWLDSFCNHLVQELRRHTSALCLSSDNLHELGAPDVADLENSGVSASLRHWLDTSEEDHDLVLYVADPANTRWSRLCVRQADVTLTVADAADDPGVRNWERELLPATGPGKSTRAIALWHRSSDIRPGITGPWLTDRAPDFHLHLRDGRTDDLARLVRIVSGRAVGLVLGAGAARGFAQLGAYKALVEAGVPVDWIGGASIGGIMGAAIAWHEDPDKTIEAGREAFVQGKPFSDYTIPLLSVIRGRRMETLLQRHLPGAIEDLPLPFFCVSTLLDTGELHVHERGSTWSALRATASMPGLLPPALVEQRLAIDGAVMNNLPVDVMQDRPVGRIVAVSVAAPGRVRTVDYHELPSPWSVLRRRLLPVGPRIRAPGLVATMMKASDIGTAARMRELGEEADLLLQPPVAAFRLTDVRAFDRIVQAGYENAQERVAHWLQQGQ